MRVSKKSLKLHITIDFFFELLCVFFVVQLFKYTTGLRKEGTKLHRVTFKTASGYSLYVFSDKVMIVIVFGLFQLPLYADASL